MIATDLKTGTIYQENGTPFLVLKYSHIKVSRGSANVKVKVRNLRNSSVLEKTYMSSIKVEDAQVTRKNSQYLYNDGSQYFFMDPETYVQETIDGEVIGDLAKFLKEGETAQVLYFEGEALSIELPNNLVYEVTYTEPGFKGNTVTNTLKDAELENGLKAKVPPFIKIGDKVRIDTRDGSYVSKA